MYDSVGSIVRIAPNEYSVDDPEAVKTIYGLGNHFGKGPWYSAWGHPDPNRYGLFNHRNEQRHAEHRRKVGAAFAMSALVSYENYVDNCSSILCQRLEEFGQRNMAIDMFHWMQCYAFDVVGEITLGRRFGFLDAGEDVGHIMESIDKRSYSSTLIGIYAEWYPTVAKIMAMRGPTPDDAIANFTQKQIAELKTGKTTNPNGPECQVSKWLRGHSENPERFTTWDVLTTAKSNIAAGSDTTAIALCSVLYHLLKNPRTLVRLRDEIEEMSRAGRVSNPVKWKESQDMPYLQAVIKEALRVHPSTGLPMGRVVPEGGATLAGRFFPAGVSVQTSYAILCHIDMLTIPSKTVVGVNSWVASFNTSVFGNDAHEFRPERWLISDEKKLAFMDRYWIPVSLRLKCAV